MTNYLYYCRVKNIKPQFESNLRNYNLYLEWCKITGDNPNDARVILDFDTDDIVRCEWCEELELVYEMVEIKGVEMCRECKRHI